MTLQDIIAARLTNEQLNSTKFETAAELVSWFGAVQSQDFQGAKWALGQRLGLTENQIDQEFNEGKILRTHIMRPTWHFVNPADIVWMQKLTSPRVNQIMSYYNRKLGLDKTFFDKSNKIIAKALSGNKFLTRTELAKKLEEGGISINGQKLAHTVSRAELDAVICSGPRIGKPASTRGGSSTRGGQFTYALVSERTAKSEQLNPTDPLAELTRRFFQSHGPATVRDFVWWSGLTTTDARRGIEANKLPSEVVNGKTYWFEAGSNHTKYLIPDTLYLLPNYDEYTIAYKDRDAFLPKEAVKYFMNQGNASFWNSIVYNGEIIGMWKKTSKPMSIEIKTQILNKLPAQVNKKIKEEAEKLGKFFNVNAEINR